MDKQAANAQVIFSPSGKRGTFPVGTPVLEAARELGVDIDSICGGRARCCRCQVEPIDGHFAKEEVVSDHSHLSPITPDELTCLQEGKLTNGNRLSCRAKILNDLKIDVPPASQVHQQVVRKDFEVGNIEMDPKSHLYLVKVDEPSLDAPDGDLQRLLTALEREWQLSGLKCDPSVLAVMQPVLRRGQWQVTVAVRNQSEIVAIWPGFHDRLFGAAIDVGSTTIAVHLCNLISGDVVASAGAMNPQIRYGEDLMSRISYSMAHPGGAEQMTAIVRSAINKLLSDAMADAGVQADCLLEVTLVGNPVMHHLLLGLDPAPLGAAPFALATNCATEIRATDLDLDLSAAAQAYILPCIAGHVGADTAAVLLAEKPWRHDEISLIIDVGTNAEIILGNRHRILAASSPTGPAFEGAQISSGQRAAPGAIERVRIDAKTLEPRFRLIGGKHWSDDPHFVQDSGAQAVTGICGSGIIEAIASLYLAGIIRADGTFDGAKASLNPRIRRNGRTFSYLLFEGQQNIVIEQADVRAIQLAKAALYAGIHLLMNHLEVDRVDRIRLAGAFGSHIDVKYAMILGLIPDCDLARVSSANNAAGTGARIALLNAAARKDIEQRVRDVEKIETATAASFQDLFVEALAIPHATHHFLELSKRVNLPPQTAGISRPDRHRRETNDHQGDRL